MSLDLFSEDWADIPVENPLKNAERFFEAALISPVILFPRVILPNPVIAEIPDQSVEPEVPDPPTDDTHVLAFVSQAYYFGFRDPSLEPTHTNSAGRRFFDTAAVTRFAKTLTHRDDDDLDEGSDLRDDNEQMSQQIWRLAIEAARRTGRKGARRC